MAYNEHLAERINLNLKQKHVVFEAKKMFGGICFMVDNKMCIGVIKEQLMARIDPEIEENLLKKPGAKPMDFTTKPMVGYLYVSDDGWDLDDDLEFWIDQCLAFNPKAKASKKKAPSKNTTSTT